jgi:GT2 family glycosyltransferase
MPNIEAIILNYNSARETIRLRNELEALNFEGLGITVIDNGSARENLYQLIQHIPREKLIINKRNLGYAGGNNIGIKNAIEMGKEYIWLLNPDIKIDENIIPALLETFDGDEKVGVVGPRICYNDNRDIIYSDGGMTFPEESFKCRHINSGRHKNDCSSEMRVASYVNGSCFFAKNSAFKEIGYLRQDFFLYFEETEWCYRAAIKSKYKAVVNPAIVVYHESSNKGYNYVYYMTRNRIWLCRLYGKSYSIAQKEAMINIKGFIYRLLKFNFHSIPLLFGTLKGLIYGRYVKVTS